MRPRLYECRGACPHAQLIKAAVAAAAFICPMKSRLHPIRSTAAWYLPYHSLCVICHDFRFFYHCLPSVFCRSFPLLLRSCRTRPVYCAFQRPMNGKLFFVTRENFTRLAKKVADRKS